MQRGIFVISDKNTNIINFLRKCLFQMDKYLWVVDYVYQYDDRTAFDEGIYQGDALEKKLQEDILIGEVRIRKYPKQTDQASITDLIDYDDYMSSDCLLCIVAYDTGWLEIFAKDGKERNLIYSKCLEISHTRLEWITDENNGRTVFSPVGSAGGGYPSENSGYYTVHGSSSGND